MKNSREREELEDTVADLMGRPELNEDEVKQLHKAEEELERIEQHD